MTEDKFAIGYKASGVRTVPVAKKPGACFDISQETVISGKYPLSRYLYIYGNKAPDKPFDPRVREFLKYVLSQQGQQAVVKDGFIPLWLKAVEEEMAELQ